jgi:hypothetical protein
MMLPDLCRAGEQVENESQNKPLIPARLKSSSSFPHSTKKEAAKVILGGLSHRSAQLFGSLLCCFVVL